MSGFSLIDRFIPPDILLGEWLGNSALGQLADSSGGGNHLTLTGTVPNASSPTPPEGDRWLQYHSPGTAYSDYLTIPATALSLDKGMIEFDFVADLSSANNWMMLDLTGGPGLTLFYFFYNGSGGTFAALLNGLLIVNETTPIAASATVHTFKVTWGTDGLHAYVDGVEFATYNPAFVFTHINDNRSIGGDGVTSSPSFATGGIDAVKSWQRSI